MGLFFLVLVPVLLTSTTYFIPVKEPPTDAYPIPGLLALVFWGPVFPFLWMQSLPTLVRGALTVLEVGALVGLFGWLARDQRLRAQVVYATLGLGALMIGAQFLYRLGSWS